MVLTPWGESSELRERKLPPGPTPGPEDRGRNQRERLYGAMVAVASSRGYAATSVADLLELSGVSRRSFYVHFADKEACFLATAEEILDGALAVTVSRLRHQGSWDERAQRSLGTFFELLVTQPAAARLCLVESYAAGPAAVALVDERIERFQAVLADALSERSGYETLPEEMLAAMIGGLRKIVHTRLHRGTERELLELWPRLMELGLAYRSPPGPLRVRRRRRARTEENDGEGEKAAAIRGGYVGERLAAGTLEAVARKGLAATTVGDIAEAAGVSLSTFYEHFDDKGQAFDAALYASRARMGGIGMPAFRRVSNWAEGIRVLTEFSLDYLASDPSFAQAISRDVYAGGPASLARLDQAIASAQGFLDAGVEEYAPAMPEIWREGIISAMYAMLCRRVRDKGPGALPEMAPLATYMALAPFLGPEEACEVANGGSAERTPSSA